VAGKCGFGGLGGLLPFRVEHHLIALRAPASASLRVGLHAHSLSSRVRLPGGSAPNSVDKDSFLSVTAPASRYSAHAMLPPPADSRASPTVHAQYRSTGTGGLSLKWVISPPVHIMRPCLVDGAG
jgi:hypothetical protein